jgi:hypothetical protein
MKYLLFFSFLLLSSIGRSQNLQLHYDFRHTIDPKLNPINYPTFSFEYFKNIDTLGTGSFLLKLQTDLNGKNNNVGQCYTQISQSLKFWKPKVYLYFTYSGGLGVTPSAFGYYLPNSFASGLSCLLVWKGAWIAPSLCYRINTFDKPSYDPQFTIYFGRGFLNYEIFAAGSFTFWTENRNQGDNLTKDLKGKKIAFFGDPQIWIKIKKGFSAGSRINVYYHLLNKGNQIQFYPTLGTKYQF